MRDLSDLVRRVDEDRWLASRFAPEDARARLLALYAVNYEIAHAAEAAREPGLGLIRLKWWRDGLEEIAQGGAPRGHPALVALHAAAPGAAHALQGLVDARAADLEAAPFARWADLETYIDATAGPLIACAIEACGVAAAAHGAFVREAGRTWGFAGLLRAAGHWQLRGRTLLPKGTRLEELQTRACAAYAAAKPLARALPAPAFPAFGYVALTPGYLRALERGRAERPLLVRQARLIWASATGAI